MMLGFISITDYRVTLEKLFNVSEPQFPHLKNGSNTGMVVRIRHLIADTCIEL